MKNATSKYKFKGSVSIVVQAGTGNMATPIAKGTDKPGQHAQALKYWPRLTHGGR